MPETCGCRTVEAFRTSAGFATDAEIIYCPLHARAAEMRELLKELSESWAHPEVHPFQADCLMCAVNNLLLEVTHA